MTESNYEHFEREDVAAEYASFDFLLKPEQSIVEELERQLLGARMLDLGVGGGRTTVHFSPRVRHYVGLDVSDAMISACRRRFEDHRHGALAFMTGDARSLPFSDSAQFDFVLFSFNGLDGVGDHDDRLRALREIRRVCRGGAHFCFSSDNLSFFEARFSLGDILRHTARTVARSGVSLRHPRQLGSRLLRPLRWRGLNRPTGRLRDLDHAMIVIERHRYELVSDFFSRPGQRVRLDGYCIRPEAQVSQLHDLGFEQVRVFAADGVEVTDLVGSGLPEHRWLYYLCTKSDG